MDELMGRLSRNLDTMPASLHTREDGGSPYAGLKVEELDGFGAIGVPSATRMCLDRGVLASFLLRGKTLCQKQLKGQMFVYLFVCLSSQPRQGSQGRAT